MPQPVIVVCDGDPFSAETNSGVALNFMTALAGRDDIDLVGAISSRPPAAVKHLVRLLSFHPRADRWRLRTRRGSLARLARSTVRDVRVRRLKPPAGSVIVHVRSFYAPAKLPYVSFIDTTVLDDDRNWARWEDSTPRQTSRRGFDLERRFYRGALLVATASKAARDSLASDYEVERSRTVVIGGGTNALPDSGASAPRPARQEPSDAGTDPFRVLFVGRDFTRKGGDLLVQAAEALVADGFAVEVDIVGCIAPDLPFFARAHGFVHDRAQVRALYEAADVFCLPARWEPYGLVVQEAMSASIPVIVSDIGELPEIVVHGVSGLVVRNGNVDELATALRQLVEDPELRTRLGTAGRHRASSELTWARVAERFSAELTAATQVSSPS